MNNNKKSMPELSYNSIYQIFQNMEIMKESEAVEELREELETKAEEITSIAENKMEKDDRKTILLRDMREAIEEYEK
jgi:histone H3/H4